MKMIIAFVQPFMAPQVVQALRQMPGLSGASFADVEGFGRGRSSANASASEELHGTTKKVRVEVVTSDETADAVEGTLREAAHTGNRGDGKIFVLDVVRALRIATDEQGNDVV